MKKHFLLLFLGASLALYSCDSETPKPTQTNPPAGTDKPVDNTPRENYLKAKTWKLTGFTQGAPGSSGHLDLLQAGFPNCQKDDIYTFKADYKLEVAPNAAQCSTNDATMEGTWEVRSSNTILSLKNEAQTFVGLNGDFSIIEITAKQAIVARIINGSQYTLMFTAQ